MASEYLKTSSAGSRIVDLAVLSFSFTVFALITGMTFSYNVLLDLVLYVSVVFICLRVAKRLIFTHFSISNRVLSVLAGNTAGLIVGGIAVALIDTLIPVFQESLLVVILSSILAFFVLGTVSPMIKTSHRDVVHYQ